MPPRMRINAVFFPDSFTGMDRKKLLSQKFSKEKVTNSRCWKWHLVVIWKKFPSARL
jgi:hypothetical protein